MPAGVPQRGARARSRGRDARSASSRRVGRRIRRATLLAFNRAAWDELDALVQPGFQHHPPGKTLTLAEFKDGGAFVHRAFAEYHLTIDELIVSGDRVAIRWTAIGTHVGSFFGEAPTGRRVAVQGMHLHHVSDGRIVDDYEVIDMAGLRAALQPR